MNPHQRRRMKNMVRYAVGDTVLDIGCSQIPNPYITGSRVVGFDLNDMAVAPPYTEFVRGDVYRVGELLAGQRFDTIYMGGFVEHVERPYDMLRQLREHLTPGGRLILAIPNPLGIPMVLAELMGTRRFFYTSEHLLCYPPRWAWRLIEHSGYRLIKTVGAGASLGGLWCPAPIVLSLTVIYVAESNEPAE